MLWFLADNLLNVIHHFSGLFQIWTQLAIICVQHSWPMLQNLPSRTTNAVALVACSLSLREYSLVYTSLRRIYLRTACPSGTCYARSWCSSAIGAGPFPYKCPAGPGRLERSHPTLGTCKAFITTAMTPMQYCLAWLAELREHICDTERPNEPSSSV